MPLCRRDEEAFPFLLGNVVGDAVPVVEDSSGKLPSSCSNSRSKRTPAFTTACRRSMSVRNSCGMRMSVNTSRSGRQRMTVPVRAFFLSSGSSVNSPTTSPLRKEMLRLTCPL